MTRSYAEQQVLKNLENKGASGLFQGFKEGVSALEGRYEDLPDGFKADYDEFKADYFSEMAQILDSTTGETRFDGVDELNQAYADEFGALISSYMMDGREIPSTGPEATPETPEEPGDEPEYPPEEPDGPEPSPEPEPEYPPEEPGAPEEPTPEPEEPGDGPYDGHRTIAISDIHGYMDQAVGNGTDYTGVLEAVNEYASAVFDEEIFDYDVTSYIDAETGEERRDYDVEWQGGDKYTLVFNGDMFDRGAWSPEALDFVWRLQDEAADNGAEVVYNLGNHEMAMLMPAAGRIGGESDYWLEVDPETQKEFYRRMEDGKITAAHQGQTFTYLHAGTNQEIDTDLVNEWNQYVRESGTRLLEAFEAWEGSESFEQWADSDADRSALLDEMRDAYRDPDMDLDLFADDAFQDWVSEQHDVRADYGPLFDTDGKSGRGRLAGPLWMDYEHLEDDADPQIVGHSRGTTDRWNPRQDGNVININTIRDYNMRKAFDRGERFPANVPPEDQKIAVSVEEDDAVYALLWDPETGEFEREDFDHPDGPAPDDTPDDAPEDVETYDVNMDLSLQASPEEGYHNNLLKGTFMDDIASSLKGIVSDPLNSWLINAQGDYSFANANSPEQYFLELRGKDADKLAQEDDVEIEVSLAKLDFMDVEGYRGANRIPRINEASMLSHSKSLSDLYDESQDLFSIRGILGSSRNQGRMYKTPVWFEEIFHENAHRFGEGGDWASVDDYLSAGDYAVNVRLKKDGTPVQGKRGPLDEWETYDVTDYGWTDLWENGQELKQDVWSPDSRARKGWEGFFGKRDQNKSFGDVMKEPLPSFSLSGGFEALLTAPIGMMDELLFHGLLGKRLYGNKG